MQESTHGYKIGDTLKCIRFGKTISSRFRSERTMENNEIGIVTGFDGDYTELLLSDGKYVTRYESKIRYLELSKPLPTFYEIY